MTVMTVALVMASDGPKLARLKVRCSQHHRITRCRSISAAAELRSGVRTSDVPSVLRVMQQKSWLARDLEGVRNADLAAAVATSAAQKAAVVYDLDALRGSFASLRDSFPAHWTHALAIKCAPLAFVVREAVDAGLGVEAASYGEAASALANGCPRERVVFDSPAKTVDELRWALDAGIAVNADSLDELRRIDAVLAERSAPSASLLGLRVNACVDGKGEHAIFAVSENDSKFGHPLSSDAMRAAVVDAFGAYPWLRALHTHVGSAGTSLDMLAQGASTLAGLADEIDAKAGGRRVEALDAELLERDVTVQAVGQRSKSKRKSEHQHPQLRSHYGCEASHNSAGITEPWACACQAFVCVGGAARVLTSAAAVVPMMAADPCLRRLAAFATRAASGRTSAATDAVIMLADGSASRS